MVKQQGKFFEVSPGVGKARRHICGGVESERNHEYQGRQSKTSKLKKKETKITVRRVDVIKEDKMKNTKKRIAMRGHSCQP